MADNSPLEDPELRHLERQLSDLALPPSHHERERLLYACGQAAGRAQMKRRVRAAISVAAICLSVSLGLGLTLFTRGGSQTVVVEGASVRGRREHSATASRTDVPPIEEPSRMDRPRGQLTATSSVEQLLAFEQEHRVRPQAMLAQNVPPQRILTAADRALPDEL